MKKQRNYLKPLNQYIMENKPKLTTEQRDELRKPFPSEAISKHPTKTFLSTLKAIYVTERLNDVFGLGRWTVTHKVKERSSNYVLIKCSFSSLDYDVVVPDQYGGHLTVAKNTEIADGFKSAVTDGISKIASYLEVGIDVFKGKVNPSTQKTNSYPQSDKKWLNVYKKGTKDLTPDMETIYTKMKSGEIKTLDAITKDWQISKVNIALIQAWLIKLNRDRTAA